jgi:Tol biopolymer transport system component
LAWVLFGIAVLTAAAIAVPATAHLFESLEEHAVRFEIQTPLFNNPFQVSVSPDGTKIAFVALSAPGMTQLYVRPIDGVSAQALPGTEGALHPFWSPDSKSIGFGIPGSKLKRIALSGGPPQSICDLSNSYLGGTWNADGVVVFGSDSGLLYRVSASGGIAQPISSRDSTNGEAPRGWPRFLPDGRHYLYLSWNKKPEDRAIYLGALDSQQVTRLFAAESMAVFAPPSSILFHREGTLMAQTFDPDAMKLQGEPVRVAEDIPYSITNGRAAFDASRKTLVYRSDASDVAQKLKLTWVDRNGKILGVVGMPQGYQGPDISPDGKRVAIHRHDGKGGDVWVIESPGGKATRLTFDVAQENSQPVWSPTGSHIAFGSLRNGKWGIYQKPSNGVGNEELLYESDLINLPISWSSNVLLFYVSAPKTNNDVWALPMTGERKAFPVLQTSFQESHPQISPDGKWVAYFSNETGRQEVYVQSFPAGAGKWQISANGGWFPRWRADGKELFFMETISFGKLMAAKVSTAGNSFEASTPVALFDTLYNNSAIRGHTGNWNTFAVSADGQKFLIPRPESSGSEAGAPVSVVVNWTSAIKP